MKLFLSIGAAGIVLAAVIILGYFVAGHQAAVQMADLAGQSNLGGLQEMTAVQDQMAQDSRAIEHVFLGLILWLACLTGGYFLGQSKDQETPSLVWCGLLGPLGLVIAACLPNDRQREEMEQQTRLLQRQLHYQRLAAGEKNPPLN